MLIFNNLNNLIGVYEFILILNIINRFSHSFFSRFQEELNFVNSESTIKI